MNKSSKQPTPLQKKPFLLQTTFLLSQDFWIQFLDVLYVFVNIF